MTLSKFIRLFFIALAIFVILVVVTLAICYYLKKEGCVKQGEEFGTRNTHLQCCPGLVAVDVAEIVDGKVFGLKQTCASRTEMVVCVPCGNGICDSAENWCNCPSDCPRE